VQTDAGSRRRKWLSAAGKQRADYATEQIAGPGRCKTRRGTRAYANKSVGAAYERVDAFQDDRCLGLLCDRLSAL
jgi:hypothetical protein